MALIFKQTKEQKRLWKEWVASRPAVIKELCLKFPPDRLYLLKSSNHRVILYSYAENNTLTVDVLGKYNLVFFERRVFGIPPEDLEECDLPLPGEPLGAQLTGEQEIKDFIKADRR